MNGWKVVAALAVAVGLTACGGAQQASTTAASSTGTVHAAPAAATVAPPASTPTAEQVAAEKAANEAQAAKKAAAAKKAKAKKAKAARKAKAAKKAAAARKAKAAARRCKPSYIGACVPTDRDYDCPEIGAMVMVDGPDTDRLDRDGNGFGCEGYPSDGLQGELDSSTYDDNDDAGDYVPDPVFPDPSDDAEPSDYGDTP